MLLVAFFIVIFDDYRVTPDGILFALSGLGTYFFAVFLSRSHSGRTFLAQMQAANPYALLPFLLALALLISVLLTGYWAFELKDRSNLHQTLLLVNPFFLVLNLATVTIALTHGPLNKLFDAPRAPG